LSEPEEPSIAIRDLEGAIRVWIEVGLPDATRLHKACKAAPRVVVYTEKDPVQFINRLAGERIHRVESIELYAFDRSLIAGVVARLDRRMGFALTVADREVYLSLGAETLSGPLVRYALA
jgi:uncharacterized protein YaeQ